MEDLNEALEELSSAEDFLNFFGIEYDASVVYVNRLHILQRYHDYLERASESMPDADEAKRGVHKALLERAYQDFVESSALEEKVFKVFRDASGEGFVPLVSIETPNKA